MRIKDFKIVDDSKTQSISIDHWKNYYKVKTFPNPMKSAHVDLINDSVKDYKKFIRSNKPISRKLFTISYEDKYNKKFHGKFSADNGMEKYLHIVEFKKNTIATIKNERVLNKRLRIKNKTMRNYPEVGYSLTAGCFTSKGSILNLIKVKQIGDLYKNKTPKDVSANYLGIEIEFFSPKQKQDIAVMLFDQGLKDYCHIKEDGSIRPENGTYGHEITILVKETEREIVLSKVMEVLKQSNAKVNKSCGLHVHLDMRNRNKELVFSNLVSSQHILYAMQPKSRQENTYCKRVKGKTWNTSMDRYSGVNANAFRKHQTIEIRVHSGTVDLIKILNWIDLLLKIVNKPTEIKRASSSLKGFVKQFGISSSLASYIETRMALFNQEIEVEEAA